METSEAVFATGEPIVYEIFDSHVKDAVYKGYGPDKHDRDAKMHLFEITILGDKSWIIVRETFNGVTTLHSISDSPSILNYITNAK